MSQFRRQEDGMVGATPLTQTHCKLKTSVVRRPEPPARLCVTPRPAGDMDENRRFADW